MLLTGDVLDVLPTLEADSFDAMLTDPPYGLSGDGGKTGFMGQEWDGRVPGPEVWRECLRVLKPGAFALVFGGTRTFHRLAVALEDAGFELRDTLMWVHSQGFPKSLDVSKAIDKMAGAEREVVGSKLGQPGYHLSAREDAGHALGQGISRHTPEQRLRTAAITAPATPEAERWQGYGTALKPAYEPVLLVRKPTPLTFAQNALRHGTGALNIDGARVPFSGEADEAESKNKNRHADFGSAPRENRVYGKDGRSRAEGGNYDPPGRWPSNLIHDGSDEVVALFPSTTSRGHTPARRGKGGISTSGHRGQGGVDEAYFDTGSAARFYYVAKASTAERSAGLGHLEVVIAEVLTWDGEAHRARLLVDTATSPPRVIAASGTPSSSATEWSTCLFGSGITALSRLGCRFTTSTARSSTTESPTLRWLTQRHTSVFTPAANSETASGTSHAESAERRSPSTPNTGISAPKAGPYTDDADLATYPEWWRRSASVRLASETIGRSPHPTHKPLALTEYLARLLLPPERDSPRRILVPFAGSGSEIIGALRAGWDEAVGIERELEYVAIAEQRIRHWLGERCAPADRSRREAA